MTFDPKRLSHEPYDDPVPDKVTDLVADASAEADADAFVTTLDEMLLGGGYEWAETTLEGIRDIVAKAARVTVGQRRAVDNIRRSVEEPRHDRPSRRRYEGFGR